VTDREQVKTSSEHANVQSTFRKETAYRNTICPPAREYRTFSLRLALLTEGGTSGWS
jgi:hypothetical protein